MSAVLREVEYLEFRQLSELPGMLLSRFLLQVQHLQGWRVADSRESQLSAFV